MPCQVSAYNAAASAPASTCAAPAGDANGIMEVSGSPPYRAGIGFNLATGLGSINAANLVLGFYLPAPGGLTASSAAQSVNLTWNAEPHATSFNVFQGTQAGQEGSTPVVSGATGTSATVAGLQNGQTYYFTIVAESAIGASAKSNEAHATIVPAPPAGLSAAAGNSLVTLTWTAATGATSYSVYQSATAGGEGAQPVQSGVISSTSTITGLTNGTTYYFKVAAVDAGGPSALSAEAQATPMMPASGGGGALDPLALVLLTLLLAFRRSGFWVRG
jgi:Fibronectin type III domain